MITKELSKVCWMYLPMNSHSDQDMINTSKWAFSYTFCFPLFTSECPFYSLDSWVEDESEITMNSQHQLSLDSIVFGCWLIVKHSLAQPLLLTTERNEIQLFLLAAVLGSLTWGNTMCQGSWKISTQHQLSFIHLLLYPSWCQEILAWPGMGSFL